MKKIFFVPIEPIKARYSIQWNIWFKEYLEHENIPHEFITPEEDLGKGIIREGQFLDVIGTNFYKAQQLSILCKKLNNNEIKDNDVILFSDYWFPGVEMLFYIRDAMNLKFKIAGILHAGTWDEHDFLFRKSMDRWARGIEKSWIEQADAIFVATNFHKRIIRKNLHLDFNSKTYENIFVVPFPISDTISLYASPIFYTPEKEKQHPPIIVFPHRLAPEKQPDLFDQFSAIVKEDPILSNEFSLNFSYLKTAELDGLNNKEKYYEILAKSTFSVSFALQETFGIAMLESVICGCIPLVPDRLSYKELYPPIFKYRSTEDNRDVQSAVHLLYKLLSEHPFSELTQELYQFRRTVLNNGDMSIRKIISQCLIL